MKSRLAFVFSVDIQVVYDSIVFLIIALLVTLISARIMKRSKVFSIDFIHGSVFGGVVAALVIVVIIVKNVNY